MATYFKCARWFFLVFCGAIILLSESIGSADARVRGLCSLLVPTTTCQSNGISPLGINLMPGNDYPFLNAIWNNGANAWGFNGSTGLNVNLTDLQLDASGWPLSSSVGGSGTVYTDGINIGIQPRPFETSLTVFCVGTGTVQVIGSGSSTVSCPSTGGTAITRSGVFKATLTGVVPATHITALAVVPTQYATQFANAGCLTNPAQAACDSPDLIQIDAPFRVTRFMDYQRTNTNFNVVDTTSRPTPAQPFYVGGSTQAYFNGQTIPQGLPIEMEVAICNALRSSCWFNFNLKATDALVTWMVQYISDNMGQYAFYEYVNEPWNQNTLQTQLENLGATAFSTSASFVAGMSYYQMQADHLMGLVTANSSNSRYFRVLGVGPNQNSQGTTCGNCANWWWFGGPAQGNLWSGWTLAHFDVAGLAPYFGNGVPDAWGAPSLLGNLFTEMQTSDLIPSLTGITTTTNSGNDFSLTSSVNCGNGAIPATPSNGTITCFTANATSTGNSTLTVDGGTKFPLYWVLSSTNSVSAFQLSSGSGTNLTASKNYYAVYTTTTAAANWSSSTTYSAKFPVTGSDGNTYYSIASGNIGHDPTTDGGVNWQAITPAWWVCSNCSHTGSSQIQAAMPIITGTLSTQNSLGTSLPLVCYESGVSIVNNGDTFIYYLMNAAQADPRWINVYLQYYAAVVANGETGVCLHYADVGTSIFGPWGYTPAMYGASALTPITPKQQSLYQYIQQNSKINLPFLLKRDFDPASNDNDPMWLGKAA